MGQASHSTRRGVTGLGGRVALAVGAVTLALPAPAAAQRAGSDSIVDALPGFLRVPAAIPGETPWSVAAAGGYGWTEDVLGLGDAHHQLAGSLAVAWQPLPWVAAALRLDGRYDWHTFDGRPADDGWVGDPRLVVAAQGLPSDALGLGGRVTVWVPGRSAPSLDFAATTVDLEGVATWRDGPLRVGGRVGWRVDRSAESAPDRAAYGPGDQLALQIAGSDALLLGVAGGWDLGPATVSLEWTWDLLLGAGAPRPAEAPMRIALGAAGRLAPAWTVEGWVEASPSARPDLADGAVVVEPRIRVRVGLVWRPGAATGDASAPPPEPPAPTDPAPDAEPETAAEPEPEPDPTGFLRGLVRGYDGRPVVGATVVVEALGVEATTDADGTFELELAPGSHRVRIEAPRFRPQTREVAVEADGVTILNADLRRERSRRP